MKDLDAETKQRIWEEILAQIRAETQILPGEMTIEMFAEQSGIDKDKARVILHRLVKEGKLAVRSVQLGKSRPNVYSPIA